jgi:hypothetical protein
MSGTNWITIIGGAVITILPQIVSVIPGPYNALASGVLAATVAAWHLYQPTPNSAATK